MSESLCAQDILRLFNNKPYQKNLNKYDKYEFYFNLRRLEQFFSRYWGTAGN